MKQAFVKEGGGDGHRARPARLRASECQQDICPRRCNRRARKKVIYKPFRPDAKEVGSKA
jgi:hypothetical protein